MKKFLIIPMFLLLGTKLVQAQLNPMGSLYYQNQYLGNPAMAGTERGWELNGSYKAQWTAIDGAPAMQSVTAAYGFEGKKVGIGFNFYNESAGVIRRTSAKATYSYHIALNSDEDSFLDFGVSAGVMDEWINFNKVKGDLADVSLANFNQRKIYLDGDFGVAIRASDFTLQASLPNLKRLLDRDLTRTIADRAMYMASLSYKFSNYAQTVSYEPKVAYRGVQNYKDIIDAGVQISLNEDKLFFNGMYHSTNSVTVGVGTVYKKQLTILCQYTTNTADLQGYSNGEFEIGLKYNFR
jgi:type IX secretion system PorP/SprF family membrane protein